jgi:hypothetical protein
MPCVGSPPHVEPEQHPEAPEIADPAGSESIAPGRGVARVAAFRHTTAPAWRSSCCSWCRSGSTPGRALEWGGGEKMDEQAFQMKLAELMSKIKELPEQERPTLERLAEEAKKRRERIQSSVAELQESLDYLRLTVKYLVFDLEATRRENAYLRKLVEQANREDAPQDESDPDEYSEGDGSGTE